MKNDMQNLLEYEDFTVYIYIMIKVFNLQLKIKMVKQY